MKKLFKFLFNLIYPMLICLYICQATTYDDFLWVVALVLMFVLAPLTATGFIGTLVLLIKETRAEKKNSQK